MYSNHYVCFDQIYAFSPKFDRPSTLLRSLNVLVRLGFVHQKEKWYTISDLGKDVLYQIVREQPSREKS